MIDTASYINAPPAEKPSPQGKPHKVLHMVENDRMAGKVPAWRTAAAPQNSVETALNQAQNPSFQDALINTPEHTLAYNARAAEATTAQNEEFGFGDIIDIANPLHHIPVIGHIYREITGDEIKPISQIVGGGLFGGPAGAATGLVSTIIEAETGEDIATNTLSLVTKGQTPDFKSIPNNPEAQLSQAQDITTNAQAHEDLPPSLLSFTAKNNHADATIQRIAVADGRTAGSAHTPNINNEIGEITRSIREPITQLHLSGLYALAEDQHNT